MFEDGRIVVPWEDQDQNDCPYLTNCWENLF